MEHHCQLNLTPGTLSPFNTLLEYQQFISALAYSDAPPPTTTLSPDAKCVSYKDKTMHLDNWTLGMRQAFNDATALAKDLCGGLEFDINIPNDLVDDMSNTTYGYSWINMATFIPPHILMHHLMSNPTTSPCYITQDGHLAWNTGHQQAWMVKASKLNLLFACLHHTVDGQPCRISELLDFRISNGIRGRNVFHDHGAEWLVARRVKPESLVQHEEFIPVKLAPEMATLFRIYLLLIRPVEIDFARRLWGQQAADLYNEYLFLTMGKRLLEDFFYKEFKVFTEGYFQCRTGVRGYRQMIVLVARAYLGSEYELELENEDDVLIKQRCHGALADRRCYGVQSRYLESLSSDMMFRFGHICEWWWCLTGFAPGKPPLLPLDLRRQLGSTDIYIPYKEPQSPSLSTPTSSAIGAVFNQEQLAAIVSASVSTALQDLKQNMEAIIQAKVAEGITEALAHLPPSVNHSSSFHALPSYPIASTASQPSSFPHSSTSPSIAPPSPIISMDVDCLVPSNSLQWLKALYPTMTASRFRSQEQKEMVELALAGNQNFVGILPTGGGKSLVFMLPAFAAQNTPNQHGKINKTIVIIPNKSLLLDTLRKAQDLNISCCQWTASTNDCLTDNVALVLVAIESLASYKFKQ